MRGPAPLGPIAAKIVVGALIAIGVAVLAGATWLWPSQQKVDIPLPFQNATGGAVTTEAGHVLSSKAAPCGSPSAGARTFRSSVGTCCRLKTSTVGPR